MLLASLLASARVGCRAREPGGRASRPARKRLSTRRLLLESLEERAVLSGGVVTTAVGIANAASESLLDPAGRIVVAGQVNMSSPAISSFMVLRYQSDGTLDPTFDSDGIVTTEFKQGMSAAYAVTADSTGRIVAAGRAETGRWRENDFALARYELDGSLDTTFGKKPNYPGTVQTDLGNSSMYEWVNGVVVQPDGKIVAGGYTDASGAERFTLARYTTAGALDTGFNKTGVVTTSFGGIGDGIHAVTMQQGKILAVGFATYRASDGSTTSELAMARYGDKGSLDTTFGTNGKAIFGLSQVYGYGVAVDSAGYIFVAGQVPQPDGTATDFAIAKFSPNGTLDTGFGTAGVAQADLGFGKWDSATAVAIQSDGKIVAVGEAGVFDGTNTYCFGVARFNPDGSLDTSFAGTGTVVTPILASARPDSVLIQQDGKIIASGCAYDGSRNVVALARYEANGSLDTSFGGAESGSGSLAGAALAAVASSVLQVQEPVSASVGVVATQPLSADLASPETAGADEVVAPPALPLAETTTMPKLSGGQAAKAIDLAVTELSEGELSSDALSEELLAICL